MKPEETVRPTDYGEDIAVHDESAVSTDFHPDTGRRMKKMALIFAGVLVAGFIIVRVDRFFKDRSVSGLRPLARFAQGCGVGSGA
jgi:hypothetical protein